MSSSTPLFDAIEEMQVGSTPFLIERLGNDCGPAQQIRELTQNSIEAIKRCGGIGEIVWDMDTDHFKRSGVPKLCIVDNGDGMTPDDLKKYINNLSMSKQRQSIDGNYGIGAKITAVYRNPFGVIYQSWVNGAGNAVWMCRGAGDPPKYGLRKFSEDSDPSVTVEIDDAAKPEQIKEHGTKVTLLGQSETDDTTRAPERAMRPSGWIIKYLNTRYFTFPAGIAVYGSEFWNTKNYRRRRVYGQEHYLREASVAHGQVELQGALAHWWILSETEKSKDRNVAEFMASGHVAALYHNELYEMTKSGRDSISRLIEFGIFINHNRVVIYVQPVDQGMTTSSARTNLRQDEDTLPWDRWAAEFRTKLPEELRKLTEEEDPDEETKDEDRIIRERLKKLGALYQVSRYRPAHGPHEMDDLQSVETTTFKKGDSELAELPLFPEGEGDGTSEISINPPRKKFGPADIVPESLLSVKKKNGVRCKRIITDNIPVVKWMCAKKMFKDDIVRPPGDLEDRAARWVRAKNTIYANADFRIFKDVANLVIEKRKVEGPAQEKIVWRSVRMWYKQALTETVMGIEALREGKHWDDQQIWRALSEEGLTAAVCQRYAVFSWAKRDVGTALGGVPEED